MRKILLHLLLVTELTSLALTSASQEIRPDTVTFLSDGLILKGLLWMPPAKSKVPAILFNHGSELKALRYHFLVAPAFLEQGYAFFVPFRRGQGLSQGQGQYILDALDSADKAGGNEARTATMIKLHETSQLQDQVSALSFLKALPDIDSNRIVVGGVSFGGIQSLLLATKPNGIRAVLDFAGAAMNWEKGPATPAWLKSRMKDVKVPIYFIQAANDFSTKPSTELSAELKRLGKEHAVKIYPPYGERAIDGHGFVDAYKIWGPDVFPKLREWVERK